MTKKGFNLETLLFDYLTPIVLIELFILAQVAIICGLLRCLGVI